jgi:hypothetical protein
MLTETLLRIPFSVIGRSSLVSTSHWLQRKCARTYLSQAGFRYDFTESQAASCHCRRFRVFEAGYWKDFQN